MKQEGGMENSSGRRSLKQGDQGRNLGGGGTYTVAQDERAAKRFIFSGTGRWAVPGRCSPWHQSGMALAVRALGFLESGER